MNIWCKEITLTDGSVVYDVNLDNCLRLHATTLNDAKELCAKIAEAIETHTNLEVQSDH